MEDNTDINLTHEERLILQIAKSASTMGRVRLLADFKKVVTEPLVEEIIEKEDIIIDLTTKLDLIDKQRRVKEIVENSEDCDYAYERWNLLYQTFEDKLQVNIGKRMERDKKEGLFRKSGTKLEYICEVMGLTSLLFDVCVELFDEDYVKVLKGEDAIYEIE